MYMSFIDKFRHSRSRIVSSPQNNLIFDPTGHECSTGTVDKRKMAAEAILIDRRNAFGTIDHLLFVTSGEVPVIKWFIS